MDKMGYTARIRAASAMLVWNNEIAPSLAVASRATFIRGKTLYVTVEKTRVGPTAFHDEKRACAAH